MAPPADPVDPAPPADPAETRRRDTTRLKTTHRHNAVTLEEMRELLCTDPSMTALISNYFEWALKPLDASLSTLNNNRTALAMLQVIQKTIHPHVFMLMLVDQAPEQRRANLEDAAEAFYITSKRVGIAFKDIAATCPISKKPINIFESVFCPRQLDEATVTRGQEDRKEELAAQALKDAAKDSAGISAPLPKKRCKNRQHWTFDRRHPNPAIGTMLQTFSGTYEVVISAWDKFLEWAHHLLLNVQMSAKQSGRLDEFNDMCRDAYNDATKYNETSRTGAPFHLNDALITELADLADDAAEGRKNFSLAVEYDKILTAQMRKDPKVRLSEARAARRANEIVNKNGEGPMAVAEGNEVNVMPLAFGRPAEIVPQKVPTKPRIRGMAKNFIENWTIQVYAQAQLFNQIQVGGFLTEDEISDIVSTAHGLITEYSAQVEVTRAFDELKYADKCGVSVDYITSKTTDGRLAECVIEAREMEGNCEMDRDLAPNVQGRKDARGNPTLWTAVLVARAIEKRTDPINDTIADRLHPEKMLQHMIQYNGRAIPPMCPSRQKRNKELRNAENMISGNLLSKTHHIRVHTSKYGSKERERALECLQKLLVATEDRWNIPHWFKANTSPVSVKPSSEVANGTQARNMRLFSLFNRTSLRAEANSSLPRSLVSPGTFNQLPRGVGAEAQRAQSERRGTKRTRKAASRDASSLMALSSGSAGCEDDEEWMLGPL